jgi:DNA-binding NarL/FixJ family response regulator
LALSERQRSVAWWGVAVRVVLTDDETDVRVLLRTALRVDDRCEVVGEANDGVEAIEVVKAQRPDVVVLDLRMPKMSGEEAAQVIRAESPETAIVVFSAYITDKAEVARELGAAVCIDKGTPIRDVIDALVAAGGGG